MFGLRIRNIMWGYTMSERRNHFPPCKELATNICLWKQHNVGTVEHGEKRTRNIKYQGVEVGLNAGNEHQLWKMR